MDNDLALIEAIANPEFSKINTFKTPPQNLERNIKIYTYIDSTNMKMISGDITTN